MKKSVLTKLDRYYLIECIMNKPEDIDIDYHFELIEKLIHKERERYCKHREDKKI